VSTATAPFRAPEDADARARALDPTASFIVQAPAGSGKTTLLVRRFIALLGQVTQPESIVAITFTRKAAAEMRARILAALEESPEGLDRWDLRSNPARLRIQTIDSLCASIVQRMPWMARTGGMPGIVEDARELYREAAQHTLAHVTSGNEAVERLLLHLDNNYRTVQAMFEDLLPRRDQWLRHVGVGAGGEALRATLEDSLAGVVVRGLEKVRIPPLILARIVELHDFAGQRELLEVVPGTEAHELKAWQSIADFLLTGSDAWRKTVDARHGFPPHFKAEKQEFLEIIGSLASDETLLPALVEIRKLPDARFPEAQWQVLEALLTLLPVAAAELKLTFRERGVVDFVELGEAARAALGTPEHPADLALSLGERVQHLLVDEFQDTSVSQFELVERLVAGWDDADDRTLFLVGDPMQSIYRFREAQVGLFLRARTAGVGAVSCEPLRLTSNFRSRPAIVDWVNAAFSQIFPQTEDAALGGVTYSESVAARAAAPSSEVTVHPYSTPDEQPEADEVARLAEAALPGTVAVLVRARSHATAIAAELARRKIPFRAVEFDALAERPAIQDLQALTRALLHPGDRTSWLAVLRAPWCGLTLDELHELTAPIIWDRLALTDSPRVQRLREALATPVALARRIPLRQCVEPAWIALGGPECLTSEADRSDCARYFDLLDEIDDGGETNFGLLDRRVGQLFGLPSAAEGPAVELMTIHKAKGLEWDTVILPGLGRDAAGDPKPLLRWSEVPMPDGSTRLVLAPIEATREEQDDPIFAYLARMERQRGRYEAARLLYVAATRARERLHLLGHAEGKPRSGTLLHLLWPVVNHHFTEKGSSPSQAEACPTLDQSIRRLPIDWRPEIQTAPPIWTPREAEEITFRGGSILNCFLGATPSAIRSALEGSGVADAAGEAAIIEETIARTLADPRGKWILTEHAEAASDLRVSIFDNGTVHHCTIDRTFVDEQGTRWIVDYGDGSRLNLYARYFRATENRPIRLGLYNPGQGDWREWEPD
jgi:ATP-dependent exoDNAse (exonuclease V) beta subunit